MTYSDVNRLAVSCSRYCMFIIPCQCFITYIYIYQFPYCISTMCLMFNKRISIEIQYQESHQKEIHNKWTIKLMHYNVITYFLSLTQPTCLVSPADSGGNAVASSWFASFASSVTSACCFWQLVHPDRLDELEMPPCWNLTLTAWK